MRRIEYPDARGVNARSALYSRYRRPEDDFKRWVFDRLEAPPRARILDVGCGPGAIWSENAARIPGGWRITLLDLSAGMLADAGDRHARVRADAEALPFADHAFDAVAARHMLYDVPDFDAAIAEARRVLRPGGALFATTNGDGHLLELHDLLAAMGVRRTEGRRQLRFGPEDGAAALRRHFEDVEAHRLHGVLPVTEIEPLIDYACSIDEIRDQLAGPLAAAAEEGWRTVADAIERDGAFPLTTEGVLFVAR